MPEFMHNHSVPSPEHSSNTINHPAVLRWIHQTRKGITSRLRKADGPVRLKMSVRAAAAIGLTHQHVTIMPGNPHHLFTDGMRLIARFDDSDLQPPRTEQPARGVAVQQNVNDVPTQERQHPSERYVAGPIDLDQTTLDSHLSHTEPAA